MITLLFLIQSTFSFHPFEVHEVLKKEFHQELADHGIQDFQFLLNQKSSENLGGANRNLRTAALMIGSDYFFRDSKFTWQELATSNHPLVGNDSLLRIAYLSHYSTVTDLAKFLG